MPSTTTYNNGTKAHSSNRSDQQKRKKKNRAYSSDIIPYCFCKFGKYMIGDEVLIVPVSQERYI